MIQVLLLLAGLFLAAPAQAQLVTCPTRPLSDSSNACASTKFVKTNTGLPNPMTTAGDMIYGGTAGVPTRLPVGLATQVLRGGTTPSWGPPVGLIPIDLNTTGVVANTSPAYNAAKAAINTPLIAAALATGNCGYFEGNANGYSVLSNTLTVATRQCLTNPNGATIYAQPGANQFVFRFTSFEVLGTPSYFDNFVVDTTGASTGSTVARYGTGSGVVAGAHITRLLCLNAFECIGDEVHATNYVTDIRLFDIRAECTLGRQIHLRRSRGFIWADTIRIDENACQQTNVTWTAATFDDLIGLELRRFDRVGPSFSSVYQSAAIGLEINGAGSGTATVWLDRILIDSSSGNGIYITGINFLFTNEMETYAALGNGLALTSIHWAQLNNTFIRGGFGVTGATPAATGIACVSCQEVTAINTNTIFNTGQGLALADSTNTIWTNINANTNTLFDVNETGTSDKNIFNGMILGGTGSGCFAQVGANTNPGSYLCAGLMVNSGNGAWTSFSSTPSCVTCATLPTTSVATIRWKKPYTNTYDLNLQWNITNATNASTGIVSFTLPNSMVSTSNTPCTVYDKDLGTLGTAVVGSIPASASTARITFNGAPVAHQYSLQCRIESN